MEKLADYTTNRIISNAESEDIAKIELKKTVLDDNTYALCQFLNELTNAIVRGR